jgi:hypothetical protein
MESRINSINSSSNNTQTAYMVSNPWPCRRVSVTTVQPLPSLVSLILQRHSVTTRLTTLPPMEDPFHPTSTIQVQHLSTGQKKSLHYIKNLKFPLVFSGDY